MGSGALIVRELGIQDASETALGAHDDVIETLPPNRSDESFDVRVLPGAARSSSISIALAAPPRS